MNHTILATYCLVANLAVMPDPNRYIVRSPEEGRHAVDVLWRRGVDFIKVH